MKVTASKDNLLFGVNAIQKAVSAKTTIPILSCIKLEAKGGFLFFTATDLEIGIQCHVPVEVVEEGITVVPARYFSEIVRRLPDVAIELQQVTENELVIKYEESQLTLKTFDKNDYPNMPELLEENELQIKADVLKKMIRQTVFAAGTDEGRSLFTGVLFEVEEDKLRMVATDTHRLALRQGMIINRQEKQLSCLIPAKILGELARLIYEEDEVCYVNLGKNLASFKTGNILIVTRLLEGQFPNYRQVIPTTYSLKIKAVNKTLQEAVERISLFTMQKDINNTVQIKIGNNIIVISSQSDLGQGYEQLNIEGEGEPVTISFNSKYLLDVFKVLEAEKVTFEFTGPLSPCIVRAEETENFIYLLLPIRT